MQKSFRFSGNLTQREGSEPGDAAAGHGKHVERCDGNRSEQSGCSLKLLWSPFVLLWTNETEKCGVCGVTDDRKGSTLNSEVMPA
ncbi:hypothetical protein EYF80_002243 [Liparis tanakae]|uniref:Uncharacterized protein n=1 Tax=Liparis tanakae TaxID=230148 RepID=A0A4Z2JBF0_9TELE|nr:hypothetical protein EYF80_002243 [Liparis tanakae]